MYNEVINEIINRTNLDKSQLLFSTGDEILLPSAGEDPLDIGLASALTIGNIAIGRTINILRPMRPNVYSQIYVSYYINQRLRKKISTLAKGSSISNVYNSDLKTLEIVLPDFDEQNKIASFLSLLNERIQTQSKIIEGLKLQKEFIARKIFRQQNRFKNQAGNEFPKWEMKTLGKISKIAKSGGTPLSTRKNYYGGDIPFLSISDMTLQGKYLTYTANSITQLGLNNSSSWIVPINSIIYSMYASVGFVSINKIPLATSQAVLNLSLESNINIEFVYYYLIEFQKKVSKFVTTGTQGNLNAETVKRFEIPVPTLKEQDKIGFFLSSIDERIDTEEKILKNYENQKKYLLVNLFI